MANEDKAFYYQHKECPICLNKITVTKIRSSYLRLKSRESDLNLLYNGVNPIHYSVWVCDTCNYAALDSTFEQEFSVKEKETLVKGLYMLKGEEPRFIGHRSPEAALRSYELAIRTCQIQRSSKGTQAPLFLRAAWIARELGREAVELKYLETARDYFTDAFENERNNKLTPATMLYLIGELNRRTGRFEEAVSWFSQAVSYAKSKMEPEIERMARTQWELAREQQRKEPASGEEIAHEPDSPEAAPPVPVDPPPTPKPTPPTMPQRRKQELTAALYQDQIEWLITLSGQIQKEPGLDLTLDEILRGLLDGLIAAQIPFPPCGNEETLQEEILRKIHKKERP